MPSQPDHRPLTDETGRKLWWQLLLLLPHAVSIGCFQAAFYWIRRVGTNRSETDFDLAITGFVMIGVAVITTIVGFVIVLRYDARRHWPWLLVHVAAVGAALYFAGEWIGKHLA